MFTVINLMLLLINIGLVPLGLFIQCNFKGPCTHVLCTIVICFDNYSVCLPLVTSGTQAGRDDVLLFRSVGLSLSTVLRDLNLAPSIRYYVTVRGELIFWHIARVSYCLCSHGVPW